MKRILSIILILILCLGVLASCQQQGNEPTPTPSYDFSNAKSYLKTVHPELYPTKDIAVPETKNDYDLLTVLTVKDGTYTITWTVDNDAIQIVDYVPKSDSDIFAGKKITVKVPESVSEDLTYTLTATITAPDGTSTDKVEHTLKVPAPVIVGGKATLEMTGTTNRASYSTTQMVYAANGITFTNDKASSSTDCYDQTKNYAARVYVGSTVKIESKGMRKIVITFDDYVTADGKDYVQGFDNMVVEGATFNRDGAVLTILFLDGPVDVFQSTGITKQVRILTIDVYTALSDEDLNGGNGGNGGDDPVVTPTYTAPEVDKAYKLYMTIPAGTLYFNGSLDAEKSSYLDTTDDLSAAVNIYFEVVEGGYNIYFNNGDVKTYVNIEAYLKSNGYAGAHFTLDETAITVWKYDANNGIIEAYAEIDGQSDTFFPGSYTNKGTTYTTMSLSGAYYKDQLNSGTQYPARLIPADGEVTPPTHTHNFVNGSCSCGEKDPNYVPPVANPDALTSLKTGDKVYIVAPTYNMALSATKTGYNNLYNLGVDVSAGFEGLTDAETWVVTVNEDGSYTFTSVTGSVLALADSYSSFNDQGNNKTWVLEEKATGVYYVKNVGRGLYIEWYEEKGNWSAYAPASSALFELSFYAADSTGTVTPPVDGGEDPIDPPVSGDDVVDTPASSSNSADFNTIQTTNANGDSSYTKTFTTANGWTTVNAAIQAGMPGDPASANSNPQFAVIGPDNTYKAPCLTGHTSNPGKLTSPTLAGGISKLTLKYTKMFTDTELSITITITDLATDTKYEKVVARTVDKNNDKYVVWTEEWVLETAITGNFTIEVVNNCPTAQSGNKDRITILDLSWEN